MNVIESLRPCYDFIVCGSGTAGSVVARRLAESSSVSVLLVEAGGSDQVPSITAAEQLPLNLGSERDWGFTAVPSADVNGRSVPLSMGKVLGGGSSINLMVWARGHEDDWDHFAFESGDKAWGYEAVLDIYRRIEDFHGVPDPDYRGTGGLVYVEPAPDPSPLAPATVRAVRAAGIPVFENQNGRMMEHRAGVAITDIRARAGRRQSVFDSYVRPVLGQQNLDVTTDTLVTRIIIEDNRATGVELFQSGSVRQIAAGSEVILSTGAVHTPKVLMHSGVGPAEELPPPGHHPEGAPARCGPESAGPSGLRLRLGAPRPVGAPEQRLGGHLLRHQPCGSGRTDLQTCQAEVPKSSAENTARFGLPEHGWTLFAGVVRPQSRGYIRLRSADPLDPVDIYANMLSHPDDVKAAVAAVELCREIGNSEPLQPFVKREVMPGNLRGAELERFVRDAASSYWHQTCTAKMGRDAMSVVDARLKVYGIDGLRIADGSIMPRVTTGNTMAPCVVIGERAADMIRKEYSL